MQSGISILGILGLPEDLLGVIMVYIGPLFIVFGHCNKYLYSLVVKQRKDLDLIDNYALDNGAAFEAIHYPCVLEYLVNLPKYDSYALQSVVAKAMRVDNLDAYLIIKEARGFTIKQEENNIVMSIWNNAPNIFKNILERVTLDDALCRQILSEDNEPILLTALASAQMTQDLRRQMVEYSQSTTAMNIILSSAI